MDIFNKSGISNNRHSINVLTINKPIKQPINKPKININFLFCLIGLLIVKTLIECQLFEIPLLLKMSTNAVAFISDFICMLIGVIVVERIN